MVEPLWKSLVISRKAKHSVIKWSSNSNLKLYLKEMEIPDYIRTHMWMFNFDLFLG
jgi:hypothetical protein